MRQHFIRLLRDGLWGRTAQLHAAAFRRREDGRLHLPHVHKFGEAFATLSRWMAEGRLVCRKDIIDGLENAIAALQGLFDGTNIGKRLVRVGDAA